MGAIHLNTRRSPFDRFVSGSISADSACRLTGVSRQSHQATVTVVNHEMRRTPGLELIFQRRVPRPLPAAAQAGVRPQLLSQVHTLSWESNAAHFSLLTLYISFRMRTMDTLCLAGHHLHLGREQGGKTAHHDEMTFEQASEVFSILPEGRGCQPERGSP